MQIDEQVARQTDLTVALSETEEEISKLGSFLQSDT